MKDKDNINKIIIYAKKQGYLDLIDFIKHEVTGDVGTNKNKRSLKNDRTRAFKKIDGKD